MAHGHTPQCPMDCPTESRRYYYTKSTSFEQSLDVYKPVVRPDASEDLPLVVIVVGSAWLGHRSIIYTATSWWNSSGPRAFARQGCVTICIRHRGSFPRVVPDGSQLLPYSPLPLLVLAFPRLAAVLCGDPHVHKWGRISISCLIVTTFVLLWGLLALGSRGAAEFDEMLQDVADALDWVYTHKDDEVLAVKPRASSDTEKTQKSTSSRSTPLVFGGYSSGGHVAATLLQRPDLFHSRGLPAPEQFCDAVLFISGVLAVRPSVSSDSDSQAASSRWLTDFVTHMAFGKHGSEQLPSPLDGVRKQPRLPHVCIGCSKEVFGLSWMDVFFCSRAFCDSLRATGVPARFVQVDSDHWNILGSQGLRRVLTTELQWIMSNCND